jgi:tetratricopeptide (TPR) repeat protein
MMNDSDITQELFERIEKYLLKKMSAEERLSFENEMAGDAALMNEVSIQRKLLKSVLAGSMKEQLEGIHSATQKESEKKSNRTLWMGLAAGVAILLAAGLYFFNAPDLNEKLFAENTSIDPGLPVPMSASNNFAFHDAMVDYKNEQYEKAISKWQVLQKENPNNDTLTYYIGACYFNSKQYDKALGQFELIHKNNTSAFRNKSQWYAVLSLLQTQQAERIKAIIPYSNSPYEQKILRIQEALKP